MDGKQIVDKYNALGSEKAHKIVNEHPLTQEEKLAILEVMQYFRRVRYNTAAVARMLTYAFEFTAIYRPNGIQDMAAFIKWAEDGNEDYEETKQTILHDLYERHTPFMSPRTHGYSKIISQGD